MPPRNEHPLEHFLRRTWRRGECLEWQGHTMRNGYGQLRFWNSLQLAHRVAWALAHGEWPMLCVCHTCDNPSCVRPSHLFLGTQADNMRDMHAKGRAKAPAKLTRSQVETLRRERSAGALLRELASKYATSEQNVCNITKGRTWNNG